MSRKDPWSYDVCIDADGRVGMVLKCRPAAGGTYVYTEICRRRDETFDCYDGDPFCGGKKLKSVTLDEAFAITGIRLRPRQVRSIVRDKKIRMEINVA